MNVNVCFARTFPTLASNDKPRPQNRGSSPRIFAQSLRPPRASHRAPRSEIEPPLIEDVFVCCAFLTRRICILYFHRVSSRHWPSPLTHQDAARITQGLLLTSSRINSRMAKSQKKPGGLRLIIDRRDEIGKYILRRSAKRRCNIRTHLL